MSRNRRRIKVVVASGVLAMGVLAAPASAELRYFVVHMEDGTSTLVVVDAPRDVPASQVPMPETPSPVVTVKEVDPPPTATETPFGTPTPFETPTATPTETATPTPTQAPDRVDIPQETTQTPADRPHGGKDEGDDDKDGKGGSKDADKKDRADKDKKKGKDDDQAHIPSSGDISPIQQRIPNVFIKNFRIPPFLLPIYQAAGIEYGVQWEVLAAINEIETDYGRNLNVSYAGAVGWMQFMPSTWKMWGVDANRDGRADPYNPVDAIFSAARYLKAAGATDDLEGAIFAYNHADWYVDDVLFRARSLSALPSDLVGSLTGLADGRFPVTARSRYTEAGKNAALVKSAPGAEVVAVNDGRIIRATRHSVVLEDVYGNRYSYRGLGGVVGMRAIARRQGAIPVTKERLFAHPQRVLARQARAGGPHEVRKGMRVLAGTVLGRLDARGTMTFKVRPAGKNAPWITPVPILKGWRLLDSTALYRLAHAPDEPTVGQVLLMPKDALTRLVLRDPGISLYDCGRDDIKAGLIDRRVLATLGFLSAAGLDPTVTSLECGHSYLTSSGNVSEHTTGTAVDIAAINGKPILGNQGLESITDVTIRRLLTLQGNMEPHQIISLMLYPDAHNTMALPDHDDHIHVGFAPVVTGSGRRMEQVLRPDQWRQLANRLRTIEYPRLRHPRSSR
jgi:hypothetical protein